MGVSSVKKRRTDNNEKKRIVNKFQTEDKTLSYQK